MRKRLLLSAALLAIACVALLVLTMLPPRPGVTKANFDRIEKGMTLENVEQIIGRPPDYVDRTLRAWTEDDDLTMVVILQDGLVEQIMLQGRITLLDKIGRWLGLP